MDNLVEAQEKRWRLGMKEESWKEELNKREGPLWRRLIRHLTVSSDHHNHGKVWMSQVSPHRGSFYRDEKTDF